MYDQPIIIQDFEPKTKKISFRDVDNDKFLGAFRVSSQAPKTTRERIKESLKEQDFLFGDNLKEKFVDRIKLLDLRPRQKEKEIVSEGFKMKMNTGLDRVKETLIQNEFYLQLANNQPLVNQASASEKQAQAMKSSNHNSNHMRIDSQSSDRNSSTPASAKRRNSQLNAQQWGRSTNKYLFTQRIKFIDANKLNDHAVQDDLSESGRHHHLSQIIHKKKRKATDDYHYIFDSDIRPRDLRPELHQKTHFKGTASLFINPKIHYTHKNFYQTGTNSTLNEDFIGQANVFLPPPFAKTMQRRNIPTLSRADVMLASKLRKSQQTEQLQVLSQKAQNPLQKVESSKNTVDRQKINYLMNHITNSENQPIPTRANLQINTNDNNMQLPKSLRKITINTKSPVAKKKDNGGNFQLNSTGVREMGSHKDSLTKEEKEFAVKSQNQGLYAKEVLLMCNFSKPKNPRSVQQSRQGCEFLRKGEGRTTSNMDMNNLEIYEKIRSDYSSRKHL